MSLALLNDTGLATQKNPIVNNLTVRGTSTFSGSSNFFDITVSNNAIIGNNLTVGVNGIFGGDVFANNIKSNTLNSSLTLEGNGTGVVVTSDDLLPLTDNVQKLGSALKVFNETYSNKINTGEIQSILLPDSDLILKAQGTGSVQIDNNYYLNVEALRSYTANADITFQANGTGKVLSLSAFKSNGLAEFATGARTDTLSSYTNNVNVILTAQGSGYLEPRKNIISDADGSYDIGSAALRFLNGYFSNQMQINALKISSKGSYIQGVNINTAVTITNAESCFQIDTQTASTAGGGSDAFTVNNTRVLATSYIILEVQSYSNTIPTNGIPIVRVGNVGVGSFDVTIYNAGSGAQPLNGTFGLRFIVIV